MVRVPAIPLFSLLWIIAIDGLLTHSRAQQAVNTAGNDAVREVAVTTVPGRLMFAPRAVTALPGEKLRFRVKNTGAVTHNFVVCSEGASNWKEVARLVIDLGARVRATNYNPGPPLVTHATALLRPGEEALLDWTAPTRTGAYAFLSSVPGHAPLMRGEIFVSPVKGGLSNLQYHYYEGAWDEIPDFSELEPIESGSLDGNRIEFDAIGVLRARREQRNSGVKAGVVVTADANLLVMGSYHFALRSTSPASLSVSDVARVTHDGRAETQLITADDVDDGVYDLVLEAIGEGPLETPGAALHGPGGTEIVAVGNLGDLASWSDYRISPGEEEPLAVTVPLPDASALALAVALPYKINYCFDPETLSVRYVWTGAFLDARPVQNDDSDRPGGNCKPLGTIQPLGAGTGFPLRIGNLAKEPPVARYFGHTSGSAEEEPALMFQLGETTVAQKVALSGVADERPTVEYTFHIEPAPAPGVPIVFSADPDQVEVTAPSGFARDGVAVWTLPAGEKSVVVRLRPRAQQR